MIWPTDWETQIQDPDILKNAKNLYRADCALKKLKQDLRSPANIEAMIAVSRNHIQAKQRLSDFIIEEALPSRANSSELPWTITYGTLFTLGLYFLGFGFGLW